MPSFSAPSSTPPPCRRSRPSFDMPKAPSFDMPKMDAPKLDAPKLDMPKFDAPSTCPGRSPASPPRINRRGAVVAGKNSMTLWRCTRGSLPDLYGAQDRCTVVQGAVVHTCPRHRPSICPRHPLSTCRRWMRRRSTRRRSNMPKFDAPKVEAPKPDMPKFDAPQFDAPSMPSFSVRISAKLKFWRRAPSSIAGSSSTSGRDVALVARLSGTTQAPKIEAPKFDMPDAPKIDAPPFSAPQVRRTGPPRKWTFRSSTRPPRRRWTSRSRW